MTRTVALALVLMALAAAGCGGGAAGLTDTERFDVARARADVACAVVNETLNEQCDGLGWVGWDGARASVNRLEAIYRAKPDAEYRGRPLRDLVEDAETAIGSDAGKSLTITN